MSNGPDRQVNSTMEKGKSTRTREFPPVAFFRFPLLRCAGPGIVYLLVTPTSVGTSAAAAAAVFPTPVPPAAAFFTRPRFIDGQRPTLVGWAVQGFDRRLRLGIIIHVHAPA